MRVVLTFLGQQDVEWSGAAAHLLHPNELKRRLSAIPYIVIEAKVPPENLEQVSFDIARVHLISARTLNIWLYEIHCTCQTVRMQAYSLQQEETNRCGGDTAWILAAQQAAPVAGALAIFCQHMNSLSALLYPLQVSLMRSATVFTGYVLEDPPSLLRPASL